MQSNNPILTRVEIQHDYSQPMTIQGAIQKATLLTVISAVVVVKFFYVLYTIFFVLIFLLFILCY